MSLSAQALPAAQIAPQLGLVARKPDTIAVDPPLEGAHVCCLSMLQPLCAPRLPEPAVTERPLLAVLGCGELPSFVAQACLVSVQTRAVALNLAPVRANIPIVSIGCRHGKGGQSCGKHKRESCLHGLFPERVDGMGMRLPCVA